MVLFLAGRQKENLLMYSVKFAHDTKPTTILYIRQGDIQEFDGDCCFILDLGNLPQGMSSSQVA